MSHYSHGYRIDGYLQPEPGASSPELSITATPDLPESVDFRPHCSVVEDQGSVGSCTANAIVGALEYLMNRSFGDHVNLSRLFVYYNARRFSDQEGVDAGATMHHAMAGLLAHGACLEDHWPYDKARWNLRPHEVCYHRTVQLPSLHYANVSPGIERKYVIASGLPIIFGMGVPEQLMMVEGAKTGHMPAPPDGHWEPASGGHAMLIVGYDDRKNAWLVRNSWGSNWGDGGHVWIDYAVMDHYALPMGYWTVGPLNESKFFRVTSAGAGTTRHLGTSAMAATAASATSTPGTVDDLRREVRSDLEDHLETTRSDLRNRLRGPGAGGGYDKGPGAGGGYDKGPGAGGGYDKGPGAGGGYDD